MRIFLFFLFISLFSRAQDALRVEIEVPYNADEYYLVPVGKEGLLLFYETNTTGASGKRTFSFTKYDTELKEVWKKEYMVTPGLSLNKYDTEGDNLYVFLTESGKNADFEIINVNFKSGELISSPGKIPNKTVFEDFIVVNGMAYLGGRTLPTEGTVFARTCFTYALCCIPAFFGGFEYKFQPVLYAADVSNGSRSTPIILKYAGSAGVNDLSRNDSAKTTEVVILSRPKKDVFNMEIKEYSSTVLTGSIRVSPSSTNELISGRVSQISENEKLLLGTYGTSIKNKPFGERLQRAAGRTASATAANGIFIAKFSAGEQEYIKYYPFSKFTSFWESVQQYKPRIKSNKKLESRIGYSVLVHNVIKHNDEYILVTEVYYPEYEQRSDYYLDSYGNYVHSSSPVFVGYRYTHAIIAAFNKEGEKLWDNSFEIMDILTFNLKERVKVLFEGDNMVLAYSIAGEIKSKVISGSQVVDGKQSTVIETNYPTDVVRNSWGSDMEFWHDNYFVSWGFQRINKDGTEQGNKVTKRTVFYFNKIAFQ